MKKIAAIAAGAVLAGAALTVPFAAQATDLCAPSAVVGLDRDGADFKALTSGQRQEVEGAYAFKQLTKEQAEKFGLFKSESGEQVSCKVLKDAAVAKQNSASVPVADLCAPSAVVGLDRDGADFKALASGQRQEVEGAYAFKQLTKEQAEKFGLFKSESGEQVSCKVLKDAAAAKQDDTGKVKEQDKKLLEGLIAKKSELIKKLNTWKAAAKKAEKAKEEAKAKADAAAAAAQKAQADAVTQTDVVKKSDAATQTDAVKQAEAEAVDKTKQAEVEHTKADAAKKSQEQAETKVGELQEQLAEVEKQIEQIIGNPGEMMPAGEQKPAAKQLANTGAGVAGVGLLAGAFASVAGAAASVFAARRRNK